VREISLRGAQLDPDEIVGTWVKDQELLFAELSAAAQEVAVAAPSEKNSVTPMSHGVLVAHEPPSASTESVELKSLVSQAVALAVIGLKGCGKVNDKNETDSVLF
jgi:hypothetical protein